MDSLTNWPRRKPLITYYYSLQMILTEFMNHFPLISDLKLPQQIEAEAEADAETGNGTK